MTTADWGFDATGGMDDGRRDAVRWTVAAAAAATLYAVVAAIILLQPEDAAPASSDPAGAVMVELSPIVAAPDTPMRDVATGAESEASPEQEVSEPKPEEKQLQEETKLPEFDKAEAVIEQARPEPQPEKPVEKKPVEKKPEEQKPQRKKSTARAAAAPRPNKARHAAVNAAPSAGVSSSASAASWRSAVVGHLNRHKRHPGGASNGTASVAFAIDRQGRVLWARLTRSSGSSQLDAEAVSLARRASPVPAPPTDMARGTITLSVPLRFTR